MEGGVVLLMAISGAWSSALSVAAHSGGLAVPVLPDVLADLGGEAVPSRIIVGRVDDDEGVVRVLRAPHDLGGLLGGERRAAPSLAFRPRVDGFDNGRCRTALRFLDGDELA